MKVVASAAVAAAVASLTLGACSGGDRDGKTAIAGKDDAADCSTIWVEGKTLPKDYDGCVTKTKTGIEVTDASYECKDGRTLYGHGENMHAYLADQIEGGKWDDAVAECLGFNDEPTEPAPTTDAEPSTEPAPTAKPDTSDQCVTEDEFKSVRTGMTRREVEQVFGDSKSYDVGGGTRSYVSCDKQHGAMLAYDDHGVVTEKWWVGAS